MGTDDSRTVSEIESSGRLHQLLILGGLGLFITALVISGVIGGLGPSLLPTDDGDGPSSDDPLFTGSPNEGDDEQQPSGGEADAPALELDVPTRTQAGDDLLVNYSIENTGDSAEEFDLQFSIDGTVVSENTLTLEAGESVSTSDTIEMDDDDRGEHEVVLSAGDTSEQQVVEVVDADEGATDIVVDDFDVPGDVTIGDEFVIEYTLENRGTAEGSSDLILAINDDEVVEESVTLDPGESVTRSETFESDGVEEGEYPVDIATDSDDQREWIYFAQTGETEFEVTDLDLPDEVTAGDTLEASYTIENTGDASGTTDVALSFDGEDVQTEEISLEPDEDTEITTEIDTAGLDEGFYPVEVETGDDSERERVRVVAGESAFDITDFEVPDEVDAGEEFETAFTIENDGDAEGTTNLSIAFDNEVLVEDEITLESGESFSGTYEIDAEDYDDGEYPVDLTVDDDTERETVELENDDDDGGIFSR